jgi:tRNA(fMet)-specific endonuclease VapC
MTYLLDTNACIRYLNGQSEAIMRRLQQVPPDEVAVCAVVKAELFYGAQRTRHPEATLARQMVFLEPLRSFPFDDAAATQYGLIRAALAAQGTPIGPNDLLIAAIALANRLTLVTHNVREFSRIPDLALEDWEESAT